LNDLRDRLPAAGHDSLDDALSALDDVEDAIETVQENPREQQSPTAPYRMLAKGFGEDSPPALRSLADSLQKLKEHAPAADSVFLESEVAHMVRVGTEAAQRLDALERQGIAGARRELAFAHRLVDRLLNEVTLVSVAPALMFDAVCVGPEPAHARRWRFGAGPGLRVSLVNVNLMLGYSFNANRRAGEPRGAFFVQFSVTDLFR